LAIGRTILRFDKKTGAFERVDFENYENDRDAFNAAIVLKNSYQEYRGRTCGVWQKQRIIFVHIATNLLSG